MELLKLYKLSGGYTYNFENPRRVTMFDELLT